MDAYRSEEWHRGSLSIWHSDIGIPNNIQEESGIVNFWSTELCVPLEVSEGCEALVEMRWRRTSFCRVSTGDLYKLLSCDKNDVPVLSLCREVWPSFESGHLGVDFPWTRKHSDLITYSFLRENSSWVACGKLAYVFSRRQGISSHLQMIQGARSFPPVALLKLMFL